MDQTGKAPAELRELSGGRLVGARGAGAPRRRAAARAWGVAWLWMLIGLAPLAAQEVPQGVQLKVEYQTVFRPKFAIRSFTGVGELEGVARQAREIIGRDLDYSDRFDLVPVPPSLDEGPVSYPPWRDLGVDWLATGSVEAWPNGYLLRITLHDVLYSRVKEIQAFAIPAVGDDEYRISVHAVSDALVFWATGQPGKAASRIAFRRRSRDGGWELMMVDSDGENLRRIVHAPQQILRSVAWAPDGRRVAYSAQDSENGNSAIYERELATGAVRILVDRPGLNVTPAYSPDGRRLAFGLSRGNTESELYDMDVLQRCCIRQLTQAPARMMEMSPSYSPDGRQIVYMSDRLGQPHIYVMPAEGGTPVALTRYVPGVATQYLTPEWSPTGSQIAFWANGEYGQQLLVADATRPGAVIDQITLEGESHDPSWAPNGRHLVFSGARNGQRGLYVIDTVTKRIRPLLLGGQYELPAWSPALKKASDLAIGGL